MVLDSGDGSPRVGHLRLLFMSECYMLHARWTLKVAQTELNETEYQMLARYAEEHKLTVKEALRLAAHRLVLEDKVYPDDPIFTNVERAPKPGKKTRWSVDHDKMLYSKP